MKLSGVIQTLRERNPASVPTSRFVDNSHDAVPIYVNKLGGTSKPAASERPEDEQEVVVEPVGDVVDVGGGEIGQRVGLGAEEILGPKPVFIAVVIGPPDPLNPQAKPAVVQRLDLTGKGWVESNKPRL